MSFAFEFAASWIDRCFQTGFDDYKGSLEWFEQVEKNERIVKALEKNNVEDDEYKYMLEIVQRWKQLGKMVREWESKKEDIDYFINIYIQIHVFCFFIFCNVDININVIVFYNIFFYVFSDFL